MLCVALGSDANDAAVASKRCGDIKIRVLIKCHALGSAQAAVKHMYFATLGDAVNAVIARGRWPGDVQLSAGMKRQVIGCHRRFQGGEHEDFALRADFENCSAAIAYEQISGTVEGQSSGDAHALDPFLRLAILGHAMNRSIMTARD